MYIVDAQVTDEREQRGAAVRQAQESSSDETKTEMISKSLLDFPTKREDS